MTKDEASKHREFINNFAIGTPLQVWSKRDLCWYDSPNPSFRLNCIYRVKPQVTQEQESAKAFYETTRIKAEHSPYSFRTWEAARKYYQANKA